jgi:hypothetical protein
MLKPDVIRQRTEKGNALPDEYWNTRDDQSLNEPGSQKSLNGYAAININMLDAASL